MNEETVNDCKIETDKDMPIDNKVGDIEEITKIVEIPDVKENLQEKHICQCDKQSDNFVELPSPQKPLSNFQKNFSRKEDYVPVKKRISIVSEKLKVGKNMENKYAGYKYFSGEQIFTFLNPLLNEYDLFMHFNMYDKADGRVFGVLTIEDCWTNDYQSYTFDGHRSDIKGSTEIQKDGGTQTYLKRYLVMNAFHIADDSLDPDSAPSNNDPAKPARGVQKPQSKKSSEVEKLIVDIGTMVSSLQKNNVPKEKIVQVIKDNFKDNNKPSANYKEIKDEKTAYSVLEELQKLEITKGDTK